jgi:flagellar motility protein MotE (MotC chaperone)
MIGWLRDFRVVPVALAAITVLFALKTLGLVLDGSYTLGDLARFGDDAADITGSVDAPPRGDGAPAPRPPPRSWAQQMFNFPDVTGSVPAPSPAPAGTGATPAPKVQEPPPSPKGTPVPLDRPLSAGERAILERLQERRNEIEARARELDMRENLLKAAEKRLESRVNELKDLEARVNNVLKSKDEGEQTRFKNLITMYENMKAKEAAKIFDRLDMRVLVEVASQLNPRRMSDILAVMSAEAAERLTLELATRGKDKVQSPADLPKIEGRPNAN